MPREIDELTLPEVASIFKYWEDYPPADVALRALAGGRRSNGAVSHEPKSTMADLAGLLGVQIPPPKVKTDG